MSSITKVDSTNIETLPEAPGNSITAESIGRGKKSMTIELYQPPGSYGRPVKDDIAFYETLGEQRIALAVQDYKFNLAIEPGEKIIYSRDASGVIKSYTHHKADGTVIIQNDVGTIQVDPDGTTTIDNGAAKHVFEPGGDHVINEGTVSAVKFDELKSGFDQLVADFNAHTHQYSPGPSPQVPTAPPGATSTASVDDSEVPEVKLP